MATLERAPSPIESAAPEPRLPPGPRLPRIVQTAGFMLGGPRFLDACRRRFGDAVHFRTLFDDGFVMIFHPALVKELFQGSPEQLRAGEANAMLGPVVGERSVLLLGMLPLIGRRDAAVNDRFAVARRAVDEVLYAEIARRRSLGDEELANRDDVFSALLLAADEEGQRLSDREVRDELVTLLLAGHETTATGLAWSFDLVLHAPAVHVRALRRDEPYLDALVKESLRIRPVIPGVGRVVRGAPFPLGQWVVPEGMEINPSIRIIHRREDLYPDAGAFRPERFLVDEPPDTYSWIPFGGGTRRCLGASFALMEMRIVLDRVLERTALRAASPDLAKVQFRAITLAPRDGVQVIQDRPPASADGAEATYSVVASPSATR